MKKIIIFGLILIGIVLVSGCVEQISKEPECILSLCDCKCHPKAQTPEELTGKICGINCLGIYGVIGCEYKDGKCQEVYECQSDDDCSSEICTRTLPNPKCKNGKCECVAGCDSDVNCVYLGKNYVCKDGECQKEEYNILKECSVDEDCVPTQCCHPTSCVSKDQAPDCSDIACTEDCRGGTMDCGCGHCGCVNEKCKVVWTKTEEWC